MEIERAKALAMYRVLRSYRRHPSDQYVVQCWYGRDVYRERWELIAGMGPSDHKFPERALE